MPINAFQSNQGTQTNLLTDNTGGVSGTLIPVMKLSIDTQGTFIAPWNGNIPSGTLGSILGIGSVSGLSNLPGGTLNNLASGTINSATVTGNIGMTTGTLNAGTVSLGTVVGKDSNAVAQTGNPIGVGGTDSGGTVRTWGVDASGIGRTKFDTGTITVLPNIPGGTVTSLGSAVGMGTLTNLGSVTNIGQVYNAGTIQGGSIVVTSGTVTGTVTTNQASGTLSLGTVRQDARTTQNIVSFGTSFSGTAAIAGTIIGSASVGAGTSVWVNDFSIMNNNANVTCILGFGTAQQGTNVLFRGNLGTSGAIGIQKNYNKAVNAGMTNQDLVLSLTAAGTVDFSISYFISV